MKMLLDSADQETERIRRKLREKDRQINSALNEVDKLTLDLKKSEDHFRLFKENFEKKILQEAEEQKREHQKELEKLEKVIDNLKIEKKNLEKKIDKIKKNKDQSEKELNAEIETLQKKNNEFYNRIEENEKMLKIWKESLIQIIDNNIHFLSVMEERKSIFIKVRKDIWVPLTLTQKFYQKEILGTKSLVELEKRILM